MSGMGTKRGKPAKRLPIEPYSSAEDARGQGERWYFDPRDLVVQRMDVWMLYGNYPGMFPTRAEAVQAGRAYIAHQRAILDAAEANLEARRPELGGGP